MKKLINRPEAAVGEMLEGFAALDPGVRRLEGRSVLVRADAPAGPVAPISGGGSGHEPAHAGYVGRGMLAAAVAGEVFTSPSPEAVLAAIRASAGPAGALLVVKNYTGDRLNFGLAAEIARAEGIPVEVVVVADDVALRGLEGESAGPRGLAGTVLVHKVAGAAAEEGLPLADVAAEARAAAETAWTMGVALSPCTVPAAGAPGFDLGPDELELGLGIHGEPGARRAPMEPADALVDRLLGPILAASGLGAGARVALLVNGLGGTPAMELTIVARRALQALDARGIVVERAYTGTFLSALEMAGVSLTLMGLDDRRLARLDAPTDAPAWPRVRAERPRPVGETVSAPDPEAASGSAPPAPAGPPATAAGRLLGSALERAAKALIAEAPRLTDLDRAVGDGDLGISLARGAGAVLAALPSWPLDDPASTLQALGLTLRRELGGTSGPLYAVLAVRAAAALRAAGLAGPTAWGAAFAEGVKGVSELGGASAGDRTMIDALLPASMAYNVALDADHTLADVLDVVVVAARAGSDQAANLPPRRGRSSYLADRAIGHPDPGAEAVVAWLKAVAGAVRDAGA